jgi:hypothetical protein
MIINRVFCIALVFLCIGCTDTKIRLNDSSLSFSSFPNTELLKFTVLSDQLMEVPNEMVLYEGNLILNTFNKSHEEWIAIYSLRENKIIKEMIDYGQGPDEMLSCRIGLFDNKIFFYDMSKMQIGIMPVDSFLLSENIFISKRKLKTFYKTVALVSDSIVLATNNLSSPLKITYANLNTGTTHGQGNYAYLPDIPLDAVVDASSCYVNVNPETKDIVLSYRYTDMVEIYSSGGELKHALHGPIGFDIMFRSNYGDGHYYMAKTKDTRKAFVNSYVTENNIYLLFSGCTREEECWPYGNEIFVYSWDGVPLKKYISEYPIYTFAVDEAQQVIYSYSMTTDELLVAKL